jgi:hypothetical protein
MYPAREGVQRGCSRSETRSGGHFYSSAAQEHEKACGNCGRKSDTSAASGLSLDPLTPEGILAFWDIGSDLPKVIPSPGLSVRIIKGPWATLAEWFGSQNELSKDEDYLAQTTLFMMRGGSVIMEPADAEIRLSLSLCSEESKVSQTLVSQ